YFAEERSPRLMVRQAAAPATEEDEPWSKPGEDFMVGQLEEHDADRQPYHTLRLETSRGGQPLHFYEMYWADLSRAGGRALPLLGELLALLLHLPDLGRQTVDQAVPQFGPGWKWFAEMQRRMARTVNLWIPAAIVPLWI